MQSPSPPGELRAACDRESPILRGAEADERSLLNVAAASPHYENRSTLRLGVNPTTDSQYRSVCMSRLITVLTATVLTGTSLSAQASPSARSAKRAASEALDRQLSVAHLRRLRCVSPVFADCSGGGLTIVQGFVLGPGIERGDTAWFPVQFNVLGTVASSEASLMFFPESGDTHVENGIVTMIRRAGRWTILRLAPERAQTSASAARQFFRFDAEERRLLDSTVAARRRERRPNER